MPNRPFFAATAFAAALLLPALGARADDGGIRIDQVWARATPAAAKTGVIYLSITNTGNAPDSLVGASTPVAAKAMLHETTTVNGVEQMRPVSALTIAPGETVALRPESYHLMLMGLKQPLKQGERVPVTLVFKHAGEREVKADVAQIGALHPDAGEGAGSAASGHSDMSSMPGMSH